MDNNELLASIESIFRSLEGQITKISEKIDETDKRLSGSSSMAVSEEVSSTKEELSKEITGIKMSLENETNKKIQLLAEGFQVVPELSEKVDTLSKDMEVVKFDVDIVKKVVTTHSTELNKLGVAK